MFCMHVCVMRLPKVFVGNRRKLPTWHHDACRVRRIQDAELLLSVFSIRSSHGQSSNAWRCKQRHISFALRAAVWLRLAPECPPSASMRLAVICWHAARGGRITGEMTWDPSA